ncbi:hypothetical protein [Methylobacterium terrae]|uniref:hypothetical protein n=1 Tax=Methylobacterium terrae TaxID=2202827 RepID=UPI0013A59953|nr:hypothetical protein [Methylobacterium terrae]
MPAAKTRALARTRALADTRALIDRGRYLAWNALTILVFLVLTAYVARADVPVLISTAH